MVLGRNPIDDPMFHKYKFYTANPKTVLNRKRLIRTNSIYDDGTGYADKKRSKFMESLISLLENISLHCYAHLIEPNRPVLEKFFWILVHILNAWCFGFIVVNLFYEINNKPLITALQDTIYPIKYVPFPALAFCNNNRISKSMAYEFARNISLKDPQNRSESYFVNSIRLFGSLYDFDIEDEFAVLEFQEFLEENILINSTDLTNIILRLTPPCQEMAIRCYWRNIERPCISGLINGTTPIMATRRTQYGFCCTFNYNRRDNFTQSLNRTRFTSLVTGPEMSLIVTLNVSRSDYFWNMFQGPGFRVLIFNENEFPDSIAGGIVEKQIQPGTENFLRVDPVTVESDSNVLYYGVETRECYYPSENRNRYGGDYTRSSCILNCRIRSVIALCNCVPFYLYVNTYLPNQQQMPQVCTLQNIPCLAKYKLKWQAVVTKITVIEGLEKEMEESLYCPECLPSCSRISYTVQQTSLPLIPMKINASLLNDIPNTGDVSVVRVFFGSPETWLYTQDIAQYWFEIASSFGGLFGLIVGFSVMSGLEMVYFMLDHLGKFFYRNLRTLFPKKNQVNSERIVIYP